jgi:membrane protein implicated in regulation of membrane protease activity
MQKERNMHPGGWGLSLGLWIFLAAIIVASIWSGARQRAEKHETLRRIVEKTGTVDEARLRELFREDPDGEGQPGSGYRFLRISGTITMFVGAAIALFSLIPLLFGRPVEWRFGGLAVAAGVAVVGLGIFFSSRFAEPPAGRWTDPPAR